MLSRSKIFKSKFSLAFMGLTIISFLAFVDVNSILYQANVLDYPEHEPFDGTTYPIKEVPNWSKFDSSKKGLSYSELDSGDLIDIPYYDARELRTNADSLKWGDEDDNKIRNAKITYSVPYMGNYELDGNEDAGSHAAVDIKIPTGTPVFSMANGTVVKAVSQSSGFGHHIVIKHNNFPTLEDSSANTVIYSSYSHLSDIQVSVGDVVSKGDQIALSGATGTATTPHLHFQIDNDLAPWHPFFPFTFQEASDAGLDFFSAVNAGLGREKALETTIHPLDYVQAYLNSKATSKSVESEKLSKKEQREKDRQERKRKKQEEAEGIEEVIVTEDYIEPTIVLAESSATVSEFSDVTTDSPYYEAVTFLADKGIVKGYSDGTFRPDQLVNRAEALKFILEGIKADLIRGSLPFYDVMETEWYAEYLYTGYQREIVNGNPDGSFRPQDPVNKAEFLKILFKGMQVDINPRVIQPPYRDVSTDEWFAPYFAYAKDLGIINGGTKKIGPSEPMTRAEVADAMYKLIKVLE